MRYCYADDTGSEVPAGEDLSVCLAAIPSAGYCWSLRECPEGVEMIGDSFEDHDAELLKLGALPEDLQIEETTSEPVVGAGTHHVMLFKVPHSVQGTLRIEYARPWEKEPPLKSFVLKVV